MHLNGGNTPPGPTPTKIIRGDPRVPMILQSSRQVRLGSVSVIYKVPHVGSGEKSCANNRGGHRKVGV